MTLAAYSDFLNKGLRHHPPSTLSGALFGWILFSVIIYFYGIIAGNIPENAWLHILTISPFICLLLTSPVLMLIKNEHFGTTCWAFPSMTGLIYLIWNIGLLPSLIVAYPDLDSELRFSLSAKFYGCFVYMAWFWVYVLISALRKNVTYINKNSLEKNSAMLYLIQICILSITLLCVLMVPDTSYLNSWGASDKMMGIIGQRESFFVGLFNQMVGVLPIMSFYFILKAKPSIKWFGYVSFAFSIFCLMLYSNRRIMVYDLCMIFVIMKIFEKKIKLHQLVLPVLCLYLLVGPLLWPVRMAMRYDFGIKDTGNIVKSIYSIYYEYFTNDEVRSIVKEAQNANFKSEDRLNYANTYLAVIEYVISNHPYHGNSFSFWIIKAMPEFIIENKNEIASELYIKKQFQDAGVVSVPDAMISPIQEVVFQLGLFWAPLFSVIWGLLSNLLEYLKNRVKGNPYYFYWFVVIFITAISFDTTISNLVLSNRELILLGVFFFTLNKILSKYKQPGFTPHIKSID